ncbi:phosphoribosyltransferase [Aureibacter tunicatorum]|nr:phosphoribosyltransferase [Aureibacter tunicatorum]
MNQINNQILSQVQSEQKIRRISYQILESNFEEEEIFIAGIDGTGYAFAELLTQALSSITSKDIKLVKISIDKKNPIDSQIIIDEKVESMKGKVLIVADDVLNSGKTLLHSLKPFLEIPLKKIEIAVLVNRSHTRFPVAPAYSGLELSTTMSEHIEVEIKDGKAVAYLH